MKKEVVEETPDHECAQCRTKRLPLYSGAGKWWCFQHIPDEVKEMYPDMMAHEGRLHKKQEQARKNFGHGEKHDEQAVLNYQ